MNTDFDAMGETEKHFARKNALLKRALFFLEDHEDACQGQSGILKQTIAQIRAELGMAAFEDVTRR